MSQEMKTYPDPVCGMTVGESTLRAEGFDDVAFCSQGCRAAFLADPGAYGYGPASAADDRGGINDDE